jgi:hypothetical protein
VVGAAGYGIYQAVSGGDGGGAGGGGGYTGQSGGGTMTTGSTALAGTGGVPVSGPGVPEPPRAMVQKQWSVAVHSNVYGTFRLFYFLLVDGRTMMYNPATKGWKVWRSRKPLVIARAKPNMRSISTGARFIARELSKMDKSRKQLAKALKM